MYSLDVNFLRERRKREEPAKVTEDQGTQSLPSLEGNLPLIIGAVVGLAVPATVGGFWYLTNLQKAQVQREITTLEQEFSQLQSQQQQVTQKQEELAQAESNLTALANIFNKVKPLSAILEDVRDRAPDNVQINNLQQSESQGTIAFNLQGVGESYEAVNYFALTLQRSPLVQAKTVNLETAAQGNYNLELTGDLPPIVGELSPQPIVNYTLSFQLNDQSASELLPVLQEQGAIGLVTRIRTLEQKGIVQ
ncbi:Fimbrial assembly family protein [Halothece sp. PCC 7418]|uniref:PilN domain-containing protein n=1 Tax=Halothece sp. (strain PCC 7418) TaxID=65093 RepID=UPI0002A080C7|nr:PilN domain-containing protein [Halothece sp. PCC 7418]AFZ42378.1 Fimbrial assembly family protein [Halothece sp. PCC 7418]